MSQLSEKTTIYLNSTVKKFIQHKAVLKAVQSPILLMTNFADMVEDLEDIKEIERRRGEPTVHLNRC